MRAMLLQSPKPVEDAPLSLRDIPEPLPGPGQVRVRVSVCGLCHTDLHTVEGDLVLPKTPIVPGHQVVGIIDRAGEGVTTHKEGDRVGVPWLYWTCGVCGYCCRSRENLCERAQFTGLHADGGYAEYMLVDERFAHRLPEGFSDEHAAPLLCAGVIGYRAYKLADVRKRERVGLFGFGASAHLVAQLARFYQNEVYVFTRSESHRRLARELGAAWVGGAEEDAPGKLDRAIIFAPEGTLVPVALSKVRKAGTVVLAGITMSDIPAMPYETLYHEKTLRSVANSTRDDIREFLDVAAEIPIRTRVEEFTLEDANSALAALKHSRFEGAAVLRVRRS